MVAADDGERLQLADAVDNGVRRCAVADEIAQHHGAIPLGWCERVEHGLEGFQVRVNVRQDQVAHHHTARVALRSSDSSGSGLKS